MFTEPEVLGDLIPHATTAQVLAAAARTRASGRSRPSARGKERDAAVRSALGALAAR